MGTMQIGDYMAWISVEGHGTALHGIERSKNGASCWVASEVGKVRCLFRFLTLLCSSLVFLEVLC
jgi:hypothetical protein